MKVLAELGNTEVDCDWAGNCVMTLQHKVHCQGEKKDSNDVIYNTVFNDS